MTFDYLWTTHHSAEDWRFYGQGLKAIREFGKVDLPRLIGDNTILFGKTLASLWYGHNKKAAFVLLLPVAHPQTAHS